MAGDATPKGGWHSGRFAHTFAAIDLGTNNCRLLVAKAAVSGRLRVVRYLLDKGATVDAGTERSGTR